MATNERYDLPVGWIIQPNPETKKTGYEYPNGVRVFYFGDHSESEVMAIAKRVLDQITGGESGVLPHEPGQDGTEHNG